MPDMGYMKGAGNGDNWIIAVVACVFLLLWNWNLIHAARLRIDNVVLAAPVASREAWLCQPVSKGCRDTTQFNGSVGSPEWNRFLQRCNVWRDPCDFYVTFLVNNRGIPHYPVRQAVGQSGFDAAVPGGMVPIYIDRLDATGSRIVNDVLVGKATSDIGPTLAVVFDALAAFVAWAVWSGRKRRKAANASLLADWSAD